MLSIIDWVQRDCETTLQKLWKEFQATLQEYINSTEDKRNQYAKLKEQDELSSECILKNCKILTHLYVNVHVYTIDRFLMYWSEKTNNVCEQFWKNEMLESYDHVQQALSHFGHDCQQIIPAPVRIQTSHLAIATLLYEHDYVPFQIKQFMLNI
jgi:hypothetical protein